MVGTMHHPWSVISIAASLLLLSTLLPPLLAATTTARISNGFLLPSQTFIGTNTSSLQAFIDDYFPPVTSSNWSSISLIDETVLRYLYLEGEYTADGPLRLPSLFVLRLDGKMTVDDSILGQEFPQWDAMVMMQSVSYSVIKGGTYDATGAHIQALSMKFASRCSIQNVKATGTHQAVIGLYGGQRVGQNSVLDSEIGPDDGLVANSTGRGIWTISETKPYLVHNHVHYTALYGIDIDAYTTHAIVHGNTAEHCDFQGIFVEENASNNIVTGNIARFNGRTGIGLYSNVVGPVANNVIVGNVVTDNEYSGLVAGGTKTDPSINYSTGNTFVANKGMDNGRGMWVHQHNNLLGSDDYWVGNSESGTTPQKWFGQDGAAWPDGVPLPQDSSVVAMLDPDKPAESPTTKPIAALPVTNSPTEQSTESEVTDNPTTRPTLWVPLPSFGPTSKPTVVPTDQQLMPETMSRPDEDSTIIPTGRSIVSDPPTIVSDPPTIVPDPSTLSPSAGPTNQKLMPETVPRPDEDSTMNPTGKSIVSDPSTLSPSAGPTNQQLMPETMSRPDEDSTMIPTGRSIVSDPPTIVPDPSATLSPGPTIHLRIPPSNSTDKNPVSNDAGAASFRTLSMLYSAPTIMFLLAKCGK